VPSSAGAFEWRRYCAPTAPPPRLYFPTHVSRCNTGTAVCGNGQRDTCTYCGGPDGGACGLADIETCDGAQLGGQTCTSQGFSGGTLGCTGGCQLDVAACVTCARGGRVLGCSALAAPAAAVRSVALASSGSGVVVVYSDSRGLHFGAVGDDLTLATNCGCFGAGGATNLALAPAPGGFILAAEEGGNVNLYPLSPTGAPRGPSRTVQDAAYPTLSARPDAGPLLAFWPTRDIVGQLQLLRADGSEETAPVTFAPAKGGYDVGAAFVGDGFLVAYQDFEGALQIVKVGVGGDILERAAIAQASGNPQLLWTGSEARLSYSHGVANGVSFARLDAEGTPIGAAAVLGTRWGPAPMVSLGADTAILLPDDRLQTGQLQVERLSADRTPVVEPVSLIRDPDALRSWTMARQGDDDVVVAWISAERPAGRLGLARASLAR
jgi:hypothetical protein